MRKLITAGIAIVLCCGVAVAAEQAAPGSAPAAKSCAAPAKGVRPAKCTIAGTVEAVNAAGNRITVRMKRGEVKELTCTATTKITRRGKPITLADIQVGDRVTVKAAGTEVLVLKVTPARKAPARGAKAQAGETKAQ